MLVSERMVTWELLRVGVRCIVVFCFMANLVVGEMYSSVKELKKLIDTQKSVIHSLDLYINQEMERLSQLTGFLDILLIEHKKATANVEKYIGNPINCFLLVKRLTTDLHFVIEDISTKTELILDPEPTYPDWHDLAGAALSVARLQQTYRLDVHSLADGVLRGSFSSNRTSHTENFTPMSPNDCYELGRVLYEEKNYAAAKEWLLEAYARADSEGPERFPTSLEKTVESLCFVFIELNDMENAHKWAKKLFEIAPDDDLSEVRQALERKRLAIEKEGTTEAPPETEKQKKMKECEKLCRGEMVLPPEITHRLHCRYSMDNPYLILAPIKSEQLYINPDIYMFHGVVSDAEIETIKSLGIPKLRRARIKDHTAKIDDTARITLISWLDDDDPTVGRIFARIEDMTGLSTDSAEKLQLAVYAPGGFYSPHYDNKIIPLPEDSKMGHRIATVVFYFSDVTQGGATVFTEIGLIVYPVKGAALFWYNSHSSGERHKNTEHAACPVLLGQKWAANVWLHAYGQELLYPCQIGGDKVDESFVPAIWTGAAGKGA